MRILGTTAGCAFCGLLLFSLEASAEELRFGGPFGIPNVPRPVTVHAGDVDGNGKLDLIASSGGRTVMVYFQDREDRQAWTPVSVPVGASSFFTRAGDFDGDGFDDLAVADGGSTTYIVRSRGDRTFDPPIPIRQARGSRWIAVGDWDKDGNLDLASSNLSSGTLTIFVGDGEFNFTLTGSPPSHREHTLETLDYDGSSSSLARRLVSSSAKRTHHHRPDSGAAMPTTTARCSSPTRWSSSITFSSPGRRRSPVPTRRTRTMTPSST